MSTQTDHRRTARRQAQESFRYASRQAAQWRTGHNVTAMDEQAADYWQGRADTLAAFLSK